MSDIVERLLDQDSDWIYTERAESAAEITRLRAELAEARANVFEEAAVVMENLSFFTDIADLIGMTKQEMSERTCHEGAQAIRAMIDKG